MSECQTTNPMTQQNLPKKKEIAKRILPHDPKITIPPYAIAQVNLICKDRQNLKIVHLCHL